MKPLSRRSTLEVFAECAKRCKDALLRQVEPFDELVNCQIVLSSVTLPARHDKIAISRTPAFGKRVDVIGSRVGA
jgi:hypothetical protein